MMGVVPLARLVPAAMMLMLAVGPQTLLDEHAHDQGVRQFYRSVGEYLLLRERLFATLPPLTVTNNVQAIHDAVEARAAALRRSRAQVRAGSVFNAAVSDLFRLRIRSAFEKANAAPASLLEEMSEDGDKWRRAVINGRFSWDTACATPPYVLAVLPSLPDPLQYRFVGTDLALVDIDASYIVDVLPDALEVG